MFSSWCCRHIFLCRQLFFFFWRVMTLVLLSNYKILHKTWIEIEQEIICIGQMMIYTNNIHEWFQAWFRNNRRYQQQWKQKKNGTHVISVDSHTILRNHSCKQRNLQQHQLTLNKHPYRNRNKQLHTLFL